MTSMSNNIQSSFGQMINNSKNSFMTSSKSVSDLILHNKIIGVLLLLFTWTYILIARPEMPSYIKTIFENVIFRILAITFLLYVSTRDFTVALSLTLVFLTLMHIINSQELDNTKV